MLEEVIYTPEQFLVFTGIAGLLGARPEGPAVPR
jgi:hypothetical protein